MRKRPCLHRFTAALRVGALAGLCAAAPAWAAQTPGEPLLESDTLSYDETEQIITAEGHVEIGTPERVLRADKVIYNKATKVVKAMGNVAMRESSGEVLFADEMEVTSDMKEGFIAKAGVLFPDNSRMIAREAQRYQGRYLIADHGVYTACNLCVDDPMKPPLWQVKGARVTHDAQEKVVIYRDATIEFEGIPVFYTPYFSHPDSSVKRKQGFLTPSGGMDDTLGTFAKTPYYFDIAPNSDLVVTPMFSTTDKLQMSAIGRHRFAHGNMQLSGSVAHARLVNENGYDRGDQWRGHVTGYANFDLNNKWRTGANVAYASDKSYMLRYEIPADDVLVNKGYVEYFSGRNHGIATAYYFQDQRPQNKLVEPLIAPELRYSALGEPGKTLGGRWSLDSSLLITSRDTDVAPTRQGPSTRRLSVNGGWERQFVSETGFLTAVSGDVRADGYWADNVPDPRLPLGSGFSKVERTRPFAQANLFMRYPLGRHGEGYQQVLEPLALVSVAPRVDRSVILPNEDSLDIEYDETNLFLPNRFMGTDKVEGGTRIAYGMRHTLLGDGGEKIDMIGGQIYRTRPDPSFPLGSGLNEQFSDYVARMAVTPSKWFNASYGFRLDKDDFRFTKNEVQASAGHAYFRPRANYLFVKQTNASTLAKEITEEMTYGFTSSFAKYWAFSAMHRRAMRPQPGPRETNISLTYQDECFTTGITAKRNHTQRLDVKEGKSIMFQFHLKNIGGFTTE